MLSNLFKKLMSPVDLGEAPVTQQKEAVISNSVGGSAAPKARPTAVETLLGVPSTETQVTKPVVKAPVILVAPVISDYIVENGNSNGVLYDLSNEILETWPIWAKRLVGLTRGVGDEEEEIEVTGPVNARNVLTWQVITGGKLFTSVAEKAFAEGRVRKIGEGFPGWSKGITENISVYSPAADGSRKDVLVILGNTCNRDIRKSFLEKCPERVLDINAMMNNALREHGVFTAETLSQLFLVMGGKATTPGNTRFTGIYENTVITLDDRGLVCNGKQVLRKNTYILNQVDGNTETQTFPIMTAVLSMAYILGGPARRKNRSGRAAFLSEAWEIKTHGVAESSAATVRESHIPGLMAVTASNRATPDDGGFYSIVVNNILDSAGTTGQSKFSGDESKKQLINAAKQFAMVGPIAIDERGDGFTFGDGARAMGIDKCIILVDGKEVDAHRSFIQADKIEKAFNRPKTIAKVCAPAKNLIDCPLQFMTKHHGNVSTKGVLVDATMVFGPSGASGCCIARPGFSIPLEGEQTRSVNIKVSSSTETVAFAEVQAGLRLTQAKGQNLEYGECIAAFNGVDLPVFWDIQNTRARVKGIRRVFDAANKDVTVTFILDWFGISEAEKLVGGGVKTRTQEGFAMFELQDGSIVPMSNVNLFTEDMKGAQALSLMEASTRFVETGEVMVVDPAIGLTDEQIVSRQNFIETHSFKAWVWRQYNDHTVEMFKKLYGNDAEWQFAEDGWVAFFGEVVKGHLCLTVEYTVTYQNVGEHKRAFPELLMALGLIAPNFARSIWNAPKALRTRQGFASLVKAVKGAAHPDAVLIELDTDSTTLDLQLMPEDIRGKSVRDLMNMLAKIFPNGAILSHGNAELVVDFKALGAMDNYLPGGKAVGPANNIAELIAVLNTPETDRVGDFGRRLSSCIYIAKAKVMGMFDNAGMLKRPLRVGNLFTRKVATSSERWVDPWTAYINPNDPLVKAFLEAHPDRRDNPMILLGRMPMISLGLFKVVLDSRAKLGTVLVDGLCWHMANEGDADGDGCFIQDVPFEHQNEVSEGISRSKIGPNGYTAVYGDKLPYYDFLEKNANKKSLAVFAAWNGYIVSTKTLLELRTELGEHYSSHVGIGYGISAILLYSLARHQDANGGIATNTDLELATAFSWRIVYEKLGLGGYNQKHSWFWELLKETATQLRDSGMSGEVREAMGRMFTTAVNAKASDLGIQPITLGVGKLIVSARAMQLLAGRFEQNGLPETKVDNQVFKNDCDLALLFGLLRRSSKGLVVRGGISKKEAVMEGRTFAAMLEPEVIAKLPPGVLKSIATEAYSLHVSANAVLKAKYVFDEEQANNPGR